MILHRFFTLFFFANAIALIPAITQADDARSVSVNVPQGDKLAIRVPATWQQNVVQPTPDLPPTVKIDAPGETLSLQITFIPDRDGRFGTKETVDRLVSAANGQYVAGSVEKRFTLTQITSPHGHGCYSTFTDADLVGVVTPRKGQYRMVTSGVLVVGKQAAAFTLLSNDTSSPEYRQALQIISDGLAVE